MDRKEALKMVEALLRKARNDETVSALKELRDYASQLNQQVQEPLAKAAADMKKIDPKTKLPGTMLDKGMGDMQANMTPTAIKSENKWDHFAKCMGTMKKAAAAPPPPPPGMSKPKPQAAPAPMMKDAALKMPAPNPKDPVLKQPAMQKPASPGYKDKASAFVQKQPIKKDDMSHPPGSPEDSAHDIVEEGSPLQSEMKQQGAPEEVKRLLQHLRNRKKEGSSWERSPENQAAGIDKSEDEKPKEMSSDAKATIKESADKPIKISPERPGQANKPSTK